MINEYLSKIESLGEENLNDLPDDILAQVKALRERDANRLDIDWNGALAGMALGVECSIVLQVLGQKCRFRLLSSREQENLDIEMYNLKQKNIYPDNVIMCKHLKNILSLATTPHPLLLTPTYTVKDFDGMTTDIIQAIADRYMHWIGSINLNYRELKQQDLFNIVQDIKKNKLDYGQLHSLQKNQVIDYLIKLIEIYTEQMDK